MAQQNPKDTAIAFATWISQNCTQVQDGFEHEGSIFYTDSPAINTLYHSFTLSEYYTNTFPDETARS